MKTLGFAALLLLFAGCTLFGPEDRDELIGQTTPDGIMLINHSTDIVYHFVVGINTAAAINWAPGFYESNELSPGESKEIVSGDILKSEHESQIIVYWWYPIQEEGKLRASEVQRFVLNL